MKIPSYAPEAKSKCAGSTPFAAEERSAPAPRGPAKPKKPNDLEKLHRDSGVKLPEKK